MAPTLRNRTKPTGSSQSKMNPKSRTKSGSPSKVASSEPGRILTALPEDSAADTFQPSHATPTPSQLKDQPDKLVSGNLSNHPKKARSDSASTVCGNPNKWEDWKKDNANFIPSKWQNNEFQAFMGGLKYPKFIASAEIMPLLETLLRNDDPDGLQIQIFKRWQASLRPDQLEDGDTYEFVTWISYIAGSWKILQRQMDDKETEAGCRRGVDNIIDMAFALRNGANQMFRAERVLVLPGNPSTVKADVIITSDLPDRWKRLAKVIPNNHTLSWSPNQFDFKAVNVVNFATEHKRVHGKKSDNETVRNQLIMDGRSSLLHRDALCCTGPVFGATFCDGTFQLHVSELQGEMTNVRLVYDPYRFTRFVDFVECYFVLCRISEYQTKRLDSDYERWEKEGQAHLLDLEAKAQKPWRTEKGDNDPGHGGNGGAQSEANNDNGSVGTGEKEVEPVDEDVVQHIVKCVQQAASDTSATVAYPLTRENRRALDIITGSENSDLLLDASTIESWVEDVNACQGQYENRSTYLCGRSKSRFGEGDPCINSLCNIKGISGSGHQTVAMVKDKLDSDISSLPEVSTNFVLNKSMATGYDALIPGLHDVEKKDLTDGKTRAVAAAATTKVTESAVAIMSLDLPVPATRAGDEAAHPDRTLLGDTSIVDASKSTYGTSLKISDEVQHPGARKHVFITPSTQKEPDAQILCMQILKNVPPSGIGQNSPGVKLNYVEACNNSPPGIVDKTASHGHAHIDPLFFGIGQMSIITQTRTTVKAH